MKKKTVIFFAVVAMVAVLLAVLVFSTYSVSFDRSSIFPSHDKTLVIKNNEIKP